LSASTASGIPRIDASIHSPPGRSSRVSQAAVVDPDDDFLGEHHVYEPHKAGLPRMGPYLRETWRRREFAFEMSRASIRSSQNDTVLGVLWNVLNPLLLAAVYYLLVYILSGGGKISFPYLLAGLFVFYFVSGCMSGGAASVISAGRIILNTAFPRVLLPLSAVRTAFWKFLPTMLVFFAAALFSGIRFSWVTLLAIPMFGLIAVFSTGLAMLLATAQVYFRDTTSFLPYFTRIWLYTSPVLYTIDQIPQKFKAIEVFNPLYGLIGGWGEILVGGTVPELRVWLLSLAWAVGTFLLGAFYFISRERDFAVRL